MGSSHSHSPDETSDDDDDGDDDLDHEEEEEEEALRFGNHTPSKEKVLEQVPETLPCLAATSPVSPQPSSGGTPRLQGPHVKVWDPCNVLIPPPSSPVLMFARGPASDSEDWVMEVLLIAHGECATDIRPDLVGGRWLTTADLTAKGERQVRALAVFLKSQSVRFDKVYSSPLGRARATATLICRELGFAEEQIQSSEALVEISQGQWEGCLQSEVYTPEMVHLIEKTQPDFCAPQGESLRQVVFRMIEFLNWTILRLPDKVVAVADSLIHQSEPKELMYTSLFNSIQDRDGPQWDLFYRLNRPASQRKKSTKSRLQFVTTGENETIDEFSREVVQPNIFSDGSRHPTTIGIFTYAIPIKCLLIGLLDCSPVMTQKISIDDSSVTILHHSLRTGWQIKRLNDTEHLRLL